MVSVFVARPGGAADFGAGGDSIKIVGRVAAGTTAIMTGALSGDLDGVGSAGSACTKQCSHSEEESSSDDAD